MSRLRRHIIEELLVFHPKGETDPLDLRLQSGLISVYESVLDPVLRVEVDIYDTTNKMAALPIRSGSQVGLNIEQKLRDKVIGSVKFDDSNPLYISNITGTLSQTKREVYTLQLETKGAFSNNTTRVYKKYKGKISASVEKILNEMKINRSRQIIEETSNSYSFMGNYKRPFHTITNLCKKSIPTVSNKKTAGSAGFLFFETLNGYNFKSIDNIFKDANEDNVYEYFYSDVTDGLDSNNDHKIVNVPRWSVSHDIQNKLRMGQYKSSNLFFNLNDRTFETVVYKYSDSIKDQLSLSNEEDLIPDDFVESSSRFMFCLTDSGVLSPKGDLDTPQKQAYYKSQSVARYASLFSQQVNITVPMNLELAAGDVIYCKFPKINMDKSDYGTDPSSGFYMIKSLSHKFSSDGDYTGMNLVRDSFTKLT